MWMSGYMLEWMLSFDNLFVFHMIFSVYGMPAKFRANSKLRYLRLFFLCTPSKMYSPQRAGKTPPPPNYDKIKCVDFDRLYNFYPLSHANLMQKSPMIHLNKSPTRFEIVFREPGPENRASGHRTKFSRHAGQPEAPPTLSWNPWCGYYAARLHLHRWVPDACDDLHAFSFRGILGVHRTCLENNTRGCAFTDSLIFFRFRARNPKPQNPNPFVWMILRVSGQFGGVYGLNAEITS